MKRSFLLLLGALMILAACGGGGSGSVQAVSTVTPWPAPPNPLELTRTAGLVPEQKEFLFFHVHAHLDVFLNGAKVIVPAGIGINIADPGVKHGAGPSYGGISMCAQPCISTLHTHDTTGVLHTESKESKPNTLGQFFIEWNVKLDASCVAQYCKPQTSVAAYVDGARFTGDPRQIALTDHKEIAVVVGTTPAGGVPSSYNWG